MPSQAVDPAKNSLRFAFLLALLAAGAGWLAHDAALPKIQAAPNRTIHRDTTENVETIPVILPPQKRVAYSVGPLDLPAGAVVDVRVQAEVTNDLNGNVGVGRQIVRTDSAEGVKGVPITRACMDNVTPDMHHAVLVHSGLDEIRESLTGQYYNVVIWAASSHVEGPLLLEQNYGELIVDVQQ